MENQLLTRRAGGQGWPTRPIASFVVHGVGRELVVLVFLFRGWMVEGDLAPIGGKCVRAEVVYFFGGALALGWLAGKWLRVSVYVARTVFLGPIQCVGIPIEVMSQM